MAGTRETCVICGTVIETPARPLGKVGVIIDLDEARANLEAHYAEKHPDEPVPEGILW